MSLTEKMRTTLEALNPYESTIDAGTTAGDVEASDGSRACLYRAVKLGWAAKYSAQQGFYSTELQHTPRYYRTDAGDKALQDN